MASSAFAQLNSTHGNISFVFSNSEITSITSAGVSLTSSISIGDDT